MERIELIQIPIRAASRGEKVYHRFDIRSWRHNSSGLTCGGEDERECDNAHKAVRHEVNEDPEPTARGEAEEDR